MVTKVEGGGGCRCGAVRYSVCGTPVMVEYCHCDSCRKSSGSVVAVLAGFRRKDFVLQAGSPTDYEATPGVNRSFCGVCGSPLFYENVAYPDDIYISLGSFDDAEALPADRHVWTSGRISWHDIGDDLPQFEQFSSESSAAEAIPYRTPEK